MTSVKTLKIEKDNISKFNKNFVNNQNYIFCVGEKNRVNKILKYINGIEKSNSISIWKQIFYALFKVSIIIILILLLIISFEFFPMVIFIVLLYIFYKIKKISKFIKNIQLILGIILQLILNIIQNEYQFEILKK